MITAFEDGAVNLMHNDITRFSTTAGGVTVTGGLTVNSVQAISSSTDLSTTAYFVAITTGGGTVTLTIPSAQCIVGRTIIVKDVDGAANSYNITIATQGSETIDGTTSDKIINTDRGSVTLICVTSGSWQSY